MGLSLALHLLAGIGALAMGAGILAREPRRARNRSFALLCLALAVWTIGRALVDVTPSAIAPSVRMAFLLGSCASAPLALHFALILAGTRTPSRWVAPAGASVAALWLAGWTALLREPRVWSAAAIAILGGIFSAALVIVARRAAALPPGPERRAHWIVFAGGLTAVLGGLSDFLPRRQLGFVELGPIALLLFLLVVCAVIARHRFLDVDAILLRGVAWLAAAAAVALIHHVVVRYVDPRARFTTLFAVAAVLLALAVPLGRVVLPRARALLTPADPFVHALQDASRRLSGAATADEVWGVLEVARGALPGDARLAFYARDAADGPFRPVFSAGADGVPACVGVGSGLARLLEGERLPVTRRYLETEIVERHGGAARLAESALVDLDSTGLRIVAPLLRDETLVGWIGLGGLAADRWITAEVATALLAVGHQATARLERIEALEVAGRRERLAAIGELAAGLAHEIRNPIAAIRGAVQALGPGATAEQSAEMREVLDEETERLSRFLGEFLDWARPVTPRRDGVDLPAVVRRSLKSLQAAGRRITLELESDSATPRALGDAELLQRVVDNLLRNAWEAAGDGVHVRVGVHGTEPGRVLVRVEDDGPGIPPAELPRLFQPFHSTKQGGTGLGLALIQRIVEAHGGEVRVEGRPGIGAAFTLVLPREPAAASGGIG